MAKVVYKTLEKSFDWKSSKASEEEKSVIDKFLKSPDGCCLLIERSEESLSGIRIKFTDGPKQSEDGAIVLVKVPTSGQQSEDTEVVNEAEALSRLRSRLSQCSGSHSAVMNTLSELRKYAKLKNVFSQLKKERADLLPKIEDWAENCVYLDEQRQYNLVDKIALFKAREGKLKAVIKVCDIIFSDIEDYPNHKRGMEQLARELTTEMNKLFREWCDKARTVKLNPEEQCIEIDTKTQVPRVTFDSRLVTLSQECRVLRCLNFSIPNEITESETEVRNYGSIARELREIVNFYCTIGDQILLSQRPMLIDGAKAFTKLLESKDRISWDKEPVKLKSWVEELKQFAKEFSAENRALRRKHQHVKRIVSGLFNVSTSNWGPALNEVRAIMHEVDKSYTNTAPWKKHWDHQLYKILECHFNEALLKPETWLGFNSANVQYGNISFEDLKIDLCFASGVVCFRPSLQEVKFKIYLRIKKFLSFPCKFQGFLDVGTSESIFSIIHLRSFNSFPILYHKASEIIKELETILEEFTSWTSVYYVYQKFGDSLLELSTVVQLETVEDYKENLMMLKAQSQKFSKEYLDNEISCKNANIVINITPIKIFVDWLYNEMDKMLIRCLKVEIEVASKELGERFESILQESGKSPKNVEELEKLEKLLGSELDGTQNELKDKFKNLESKYSFLLKWSAKSAPNVGNIFNQYEEFNQIFQSRRSIIDSFKELLKSKTQAVVNTLETEILEFSKRWSKLSESNKENKETLDEIHLEIDHLAQEFKQTVHSCQYFNFTMPDSFKAFEDILQEIEELDCKLQLLSAFEAGFSSYFELEWLASRNKLNTIESYLSQWEEENPSCGSAMKNKITEWRDFIALLKLCRGECFVKTHWDEFLSLLGLEKEVEYDSLKLKHLVAKKSKILASKEAIKELNARSVSEMAVRETFNELDSFAATAHLDLYEYQTSTGSKVSLIKNWRTVLNQISESIMSLQSLKHSQGFSNDLAEKATQWEERLATLDSVLGLLNFVQRKWTYLEPLYGNNRDASAFTEAIFFKSSNDFQNILRAVESDSHVVRLLRIPNISNQLKEIDATFNNCQKKLNAFMEESRDRFPRFYFLADDELLLILAGKVEISEAGLLKKLFNNSIGKVHMKEDRVVEVESPEGEILTLANPVSLDKEKGSLGVENWLRNLEKEIKSSLKRSFFNAMRKNIDFNDGAFNLPSQVLSLVQWVKFTKEAENAIQNEKLPQLKSNLGKQLNFFTKQDFEDADKVLKIKIKSMILDTIHFLSVVDELLHESVNSLESWGWLRQLRYYVDTRSEKVKVIMGTAVTEYSFEYLGCYGASKLVHTPLTDKCYLVCLQAVSIGLGGNPYGPAGTGKTETVKALGQQLGRQVLVFNCDEAIDINSILRILTGLIKCGFWGCFDEFNRLQLDVLSALSSQIQGIQDALKTSAKTVAVAGVNIEINSDSGIFVTLNPAGKQYKGRNRLPDNLKSLFLPVSMTVPDCAIIARVLLLSEGFELESSDEIGRKITLWFELAKFFMSHQKHYDWGLRAIKSCLTASGRNLRKSEQSKEVFVVTSAMRKQIKSKLVEEDEEKFETLVGDVFGEEAKSEGLADGQRFKEAAIEAFQSKGLVYDEAQLLKLVELDEQLKSRLGVALLGPSGVGKSTLWKLLIEVRRILEGVTLVPVIINPKAVCRQKLLGFIDDETREWQDGVFTSKSREIARDDSGDRFFLIFDGDIDPEWVEALNSVLDDNKVLTLPSGERIDFDLEKVNLIFETTSLNYASPATISRLGVVSLGNIKTQFLLQCGLKEVSVDHSLTEILGLVSESLDSLSITQCKTILSHVKHLKDSKRNVNELSLIFSNSSQTEGGSVHIKDTLIVTPSVAKVLRFLSPWMDTAEALLLVGERGVGKHTILSETILKTGMVVVVNCYPNICPQIVVEQLKSACSIVHHGSQKVLKASNGAKLIIYVRHLELVEPDKWGSKFLVAFLTTLLSYSGMYDESTLEWMILDNFQVLATCSSIENLDSRLSSLFHLVKVDLPSFDEIEEILKLSCPKTVEWKNSFSSRLTKVMKELSILKENLDFIRNGKKAIASLMLHEEVTDQVMWREAYRALKSEFKDGQTQLAMSLNSVFGKPKEEHFYYCPSLGSKYKKQSTDEFSSFIKKALSSWVNESEIVLPTVGLVKESLEVFSEISCFLADSKPGTQGIIAVGSSGSGRRMAVKTLAHYFNYDTLWTAKDAISERQLTTDLKNLFESEEEDAARKKILILADGFHLRSMPFLQIKIYDLLCNYNGPLVVKMVILLDNLTNKDYSMWSRKCNVYWTSTLSEESLTNLPNLIGGFEKVGQMTQLFPQLMKVVKKVPFTPRRYLAFLDSFNKLFQLKSNSLKEKLEHLRKGVGKLDEASKEVKRLKDEATVQQKDLAAKRQEADDALNLITNSMQASEGQKVELEEIKARTEKEAAKIRIRKQEIEEELKEIGPTLAAAKAAVGGIKSESLSEIRSLRAPPEVIRDILEGVLRLMGVNDTSWVSMKSFLSRRGVKDEIMNFDARKISPEMSAKVEALLKSKPDSFEEQNAKRASAAAAPLAIWLKANVAYSRVLQKIKPLEVEQNKLEAGLSMAKNRMQSLSGELEGVENQVGHLRTRLNQVTVEAARLEVNLKRTTEVLNRSEALINELSSEFTRWKSQLSELENEFESLPGRCLVTAAFINFAGCESSSEERNSLLQTWNQMVGTESFSLTTFLDLDSEDDVFFGVPSSFLTPLIIDPTRKVYSKISDAETIDLSKHDWLKSLELSLRFGRTAIIDGFNKPKVALLSLLRNELFGAEGSRQWVFIGDKRVDFNPNFILYLVAADISQDINSNPLLNIINLTPSNASVSKSFLSLVISTRKPELERRKSEIDLNNRNLERRLKGLEAELLSKLTAATGNILDNEELIQSLRNIKKSTKEIETSLKESAKIATDLNKERSQYEELSVFASELYFCVRELVHLNPMYKFGVKEYEHIFIESLKSSKNLTNESLLQTVYLYISRALFPQHKKVFKRFLESRYGPKFSSLLLDDNDSRLSSVLEKAAKSSSNKLVLVITAPGSDPLTEVYEIAKALQLEDCFFQSMSSDSIKRAEEALRLGTSRFICLSNLHYVPSWLPHLSKLVISLKHSPESLIILVSECHESFPTPLLESAVKFVYESAPGLYPLVKKLQMDSNSRSISELNSVCYFHAVCCERKNFIPFGWTKDYEFGFNDFKSCVAVLEQVKRAKDRQTQLQTISGLLESVIYGGKIDSTVDFAILQVLIKRWFLNQDIQVDFERLVKSEPLFKILELPSNIDRWKNQVAEEEIKKGIQALEKATDAHQKEDEIKKLKIIWEKINFNQASGLRGFSAKTKGGHSPMYTFLASEWKQVINLGNLINGDLHCKNEEIYTLLVGNKVPDSWSTIWPTGPEEADKFIQTFGHILTQLQKKVFSSDLLDFELPFLFNFSSFVNAVKQEAARQLSTDIASVKTKPIWGDSNLRGVANQYTISLTGIMIEGAQFDGTILLDSSEDSSLQANMPRLNLAFIRKEDNKPANYNEAISLPLYGSSAREEVLLWLEVPCKPGTKDHWIGSGVALLIPSS